LYQSQCAGELKCPVECVHKGREINASFELSAFTSLLVLVPGFVADFIRCRAESEKSFPTQKTRAEDEKKTFTSWSLASLEANGHGTCAHRWNVILMAVARLRC